MTNLPTSKEIRLYIDGELTPEESARLESLIESDESLRQRVDFERKLKGRVSDVMTGQDSAAPPELAAQIRAKLDNNEPAVAGSISPQPRTAWFEGPRRANIFAVAATLAIVAGAVLFGIFGQPIDKFRPNPATDVITDSSLFVAGEHDRCVNDEASLNQKIKYTNPVAAYQFISTHLDTISIPVIDLSAFGYEFVGAGPCGVPSAERSAHVMFRKLNSDKDMPPMVSIFMVPDTGQFRYNVTLDAATGNWSVCPGESLTDRRVLISTDGQIAYFLCCCDENDLERIARSISLQTRTP